MSTNRLGWALPFVVALFAAPLARAHELSCSKLVNGREVEDVSTYPVDLVYRLRVTNVHPTMASDLLEADDALLRHTSGFEFMDDPTKPVTIPLGGHLEKTVTVHLDSYEDCLALAAADGAKDDAIDNVFEVGWDEGEAQCRARVVCHPPSSEGCDNTDESTDNDCACDDTDTNPKNDCSCESDGGTGGTTRSLGYYANHPDALAACLDALGPVRLGGVTLDSLSEAEGLLFANPAKYDDGSPRSHFDRGWLELAKGALVGLCNEALFGSTPTPPDLLTEALDALSTGSCADFDALAGELETFDGSGECTAFPTGFLEPTEDHDLAVCLADQSDPTGPTSGTCVR